MWNRSSGWGWNDSGSTDDWHDDDPWRSSKSSGQVSQSSHSWSYPATISQKGVRSEVANSSWKVQEAKLENDKDAQHEKELRIIKSAKILHDFLTSAQSRQEFDLPNLEQVAQEKDLQIPAKDMLDEESSSSHASEDSAKEVDFHFSEKHSTSRTHQSPDGKLSCCARMLSFGRQFLVLFQSENTELLPQASGNHANSTAKPRNRWRSATEDSLASHAKKFQ